MHIVQNKDDVDANSIIDDGPPWDSAHDFREWCQRGFHPTARLDGRMQWFSVRNLRNTQINSVVACPRDVRQFIELERLHHAVRTRTFYAPESASYGFTYYVSLIPGPVVDWFTCHTLHAVHEQIVEYLVLRIVTGISDAEGILRDSCQFYQPQIKALLAKYEQILPPRIEIDELAVRKGTFDETAYEAREKAELELLKDAATRLPPWLAPRSRRLQNEHYDVTYWSLPDWYRPFVPQEFPWERPGHPLYDELGVVTYGITSDDEEGLVAAEVWDATEEKHRAARRAKKSPQPLPPHPQSLTDELRRSESCRFAFEFLTYARHQGKAWARSTAPVTADVKGRVYLIQDGQGRVKIGWTAEDPEKRLAALQTGNADTLILIGSIPGAQELERQLHGLYAHCKVRDERTEWFALKPSDVIAILAMGKST